MTEILAFAEQNSSAEVWKTVCTALAIVFMFAMPALILWLTKKFKFLKTIGAIALCYALGFVVSLIPIPYDRSLTQTVASVLVAAAIPLILFTFDITSVRKLAKKTIISFVLVIVSTVAVACAAYFVAKAAGVANASQLSGMATGLYIGGTPNLVAIGTAVFKGGNGSEVITAANTSDFFVGGIYFLLILTIIRPVYRKLLGDKQIAKPRKSKATAATEQAAETSGTAYCVQTGNVQADGANTETRTATAVETEYDYKSIPRDKKSIGKLIGVIALAIGCLAVGAGLEILINDNMDGSMYIMIAVSVLGIAFSFVKPIRNVQGSYQIGQYLILIFSLGLSMSIDISVLAKEILPTLAFFACVQTSCIIVHFVLCKIFRIDGGTALITSTAGIYGPPFIAPVANAYGDRELIAPGIICGTLGLAVGNLLGIGVANLLALL